MSKTARVTRYSRVAYFKKDFSRFRIRESKLFRIIQTEFRIVHQLAVPPSLINEVSRLLHSIGHPGRDKTAAFIRERFFWPGMFREASEKDTHRSRGNFESKIIKELSGFVALHDQEQPLIIRWGTVSLKVLIAISSKC